MTPLPPWVNVTEGSWFNETEGTGGSWFNETNFNSTMPFPFEGNFNLYFQIIWLHKKNYLEHLYKISIVLFKVTYYIL